MRWTGLPLLVLAMTGCSHPKPSTTPEIEQASSPDVAQMPDQPLSDEQVLALLDRYHYRMTDLTSARWSPFWCSITPKNKQSTADSSEHGRKAYFLWSNKPGEYYDIAADELASAPIGMTLVKESWTPAEGVEGVLFDVSSENIRYTTDPEVEEWGEPAIAEPYGLFVLHKLDQSTPNTDNGWVYATTNFEGTEVIEVGMIDSCISCHESAPHDRLYGVVTADDDVREHKLYELRTASERALRVDQSPR
ncbi:MAG: hypothetical protein H6808_08055 [Phycisphaera sp.]|nr:hypothetical protein [Phycisphaera sp.]